MSFRHLWGNFWGNFSRIGIYPAMSLKEAREEREELRGLVARGIDPKLYRQNEAQRQAEQMNNTFEAVARKWHADQAAKPDKWKPDHAGRVIRSLELHIFPDLARRQIGEIMPLEVLGLLQRLEAAGKHNTAHKVYDVVNQVFRYAVMLRLCIFNRPRRRGHDRRPAMLRFMARTGGQGQIRR